MTMVGTIGLDAIPHLATFCRFLWIRPFNVSDIAQSGIEIAAGKICTALVILSWYFERGHFSRNESVKMPLKLEMCCCTTMPDYLDYTSVGLQLWTCKLCRTKTGLTLTQTFNKNGTNAISTWTWVFMTPIVLHGILTIYENCLAQFPIFNS